MVLLSLPACRRTTPEPTGSGTITATTSPVPISTSTPPEAQRLRTCPSVVPGAVTTVREAPEGITLSITGPSDNAIAQIRQRAKDLAAAADATRGKHMGSGGGNAQFGRCPVVMRNTKLDVREIPAGVAITLTPSQPSELEWLRREVESRAAQIDKPL